MSVSYPTGRRLEGKVALISGGARGMGESHARAMVAQGAKVVLGDILDTEGEALAKELGDSAVYVHLDVTKREQWAAAVDTAVKTFGKLNVLVNNAGIANFGPIGEFTPEQWDTVIAINLTGVYLTCQAVLPAMIKQRNGAIVATASVAGISGVPSTASYSAAKAGVVGLVRQMAADFSQYNIRANAICPGTVPTPLVVSAYEQRGFIKDNDVDGAFKQASERFPMNRVGKIDDPALLTLFLLSDESSWLTGQAIAIDGGLTQVAWKPGR